MVDFTDKQFWIFESKWPNDAYGFTFLGRAIKLLGKYLFPTEWTGAEVATEAPYPREMFFIDGVEGTAPKPLFWLEVNHVAMLARVLRENHPEIVIGRTPGPGGRPVLTEEQYFTGLSTIERINPVREAALVRMAKVSAALGTALRDGNMKFALLPEPGGEFLTSTKSFWWNIQSMAHRWKRCQMSPADPFSVAFAGAGFMHIFVDAADFASFVASLPKPQAAAHAPKPPMQTTSNATHEDAKALLANWRPAKRTRDGFEAHCREHGISSTAARAVYPDNRRGRKPA